MDDIDTSLWYGELETEWRQHLPHFTDQELLDMFPESKRIFSAKIREWKHRRLKLAQVIREKLNTVYRQVSANDQWFYKALIKNFDLPKLRVIDNHIIRLKRLQGVAQKKSLPKGWITAEHITYAKMVPIVDFIGTYIHLRKVGNTFIGLCPLHKERTPSFVVYPNSNSWYCYGCNIGGDAITLVMKLQELPFIEAVRKLNY